MTVSTTTLRNDYTGNGSTTAFAGGFYILDASHVKVIRTDTSTTPATVTTLALNSDYTVANMTSSGFTVNTTTAPTSTQKLTLLRNVPLTQLTHYVENDPFPAASHENALDQLTMEAQQMQEELNRALTLPSQLTGVSTTLPTPSANMGLKWAPDGKSIINSTYDPDGEATSAANSASAAATSASNASTSATNASNSASQAATSATNAGNSASQAATSASNAQAAASSIGFKNVKFLTHANSPYTVQPGDTGYLISVDTSGGNVVLNLPAISGLVLPVSYGFKKSTNDANTLTLNCGGTDTFDSGSASKAIDSGGAGTTLTPEIATTPDKWVTSDWGTLAGQGKYQQFAAGTDFTAGTTASLTLTNAPLPASATDIRLYFDGSFQQHSEWSYNPATGVITFTSAIPAGVSTVEADWSTPLVVGTPADGTVTGAKIASGDAANIRTQIGVTQATESNVGIAAVASQTVTNTGTDDATIVTPKKLRWGVSMSLAANGYIFLPSWLGGFGLQWATGANQDQDTNIPLTFPTAFPNACFAVVVGAAGSYTSGVTDSCFIANSIMKTGFNCQRGANGGNTSHALQPTYWAIGN